MPITFFPTDPVAARGIAAYNEGLNREAIGRMQEAAALTQAQLQAQAQRDALQQSYFQNQQANALRQQEMQNESAYRNQLLGNQRAQTEAQMAWQKALRDSTISEAEKDRTSRERIATTTYGSRGQPSAVDIQDSNNNAQAMAGRLNFALKALRDSQAADLAKVESDFKANMNSWSPFTRDSTYEKRKSDALAEIGNRYRQQMSQLIQSVPQDAPLDFNGVEFVPKMIVLPTTGTAVSAPPPSAVPPTAQPSVIPPPAQTFFQQPTNTAAPSVPAPRPQASERKVHVRFPNGAEADIPESSVQDATTRLGATVVQPPMPQAYFGAGGAPGMIMNWQQLLSR